MNNGSPGSWAKRVVYAVCFGLAASLAPPADMARAAETAPVRIAFVGDSMADGLWGAFFRRLGKDKCLAERVKLIRKTKNGAGLARRDLIDWPTEIAAMAKDGTDLFVGSFGINDRQAIVDESKARIEYGTPEFDPQYQAIAEAALRAATAGGASIMLLGLPVMLDPAVDADAKDKNRLFAERGGQSRLAARHLRQTVVLAARRRRIQAVSAQRQQSGDPVSRGRRHPLHAARLRFGDGLFLSPGLG